MQPRSPPSHGKRPGGRPTPTATATASRALLFSALLLVSLVPVAVVGAEAGDDDGVLFAALSRLFVLRSQAGLAGDLQPCRRRMLDLMRRQRIPATADGLRALADADLVRVGLLAAMGGLGQWVRDPSTDSFLVDDDGRLVRALVPTTVENDVMLCIICALLTVIAVFHVLLPATAGAAAAASSSSSSHG